MSTERSYWETVQQTNINKLIQVNKDITRHIFMLNLLCLREWANSISWEKRILKDYIVLAV